ncbi:rifampicin resistance protein [Cetacean poxvirus 1]|nr:rifampicin resistance protein [Cetacean poxvirus 1]
MNNTIISSVLSSDDIAKRYNVFGVDYYNPTIYMPQYITLPGVVTKDCQYTSVFEIRDQYITALNNFVLSIELPEVRGIGSFCYVPYVGYKCIKNVSISSANGSLWDISGEDLFMSCIDNKVALELSGYSNELSDISSGVTPNDTIKEATILYVYIKTPFDKDNTFSSLKLSDTKISISITFNAVSDIIIYDAVFNYENFVKEFVYVSELSFIGYMVKNIQIKPSYIEKPRRILGQINQSTVVVTDVYAATSLSVYVKPYYANTDNRFISYPGFLQSEKDYINSFVNRLLEDLVIVVKGKPKGFPETADIVEIPENGTVSIQDADVFVKIDNVPSDMTVYLHTNILMFGTRKNSFIYNLSKKFSVITGTYSLATNRIIYTNIIHNINIIDASIPVCIWTCQRNVYHGDNRSIDSKLKDLFINDPFIKGIDFKNKTEIISRLEVRFGNDVLYSETSPISKVYNKLLTDNMDGTRSLKFNFTPATFFKPTSIIANPARGKDKLSIRVVFSNIDSNNPIYHIPKQMVVVCNELYHVTHNSGLNIAKVMNQE